MNCSIRSDLARERQRAEAPMRARAEVDYLTVEKLRLEIKVLEAELAGKSSPKRRRAP